MCKARGTSPTATCVKITGSKGNLENWKAGMIKPAVLIALCDYLDCSADYLLCRTPIPSVMYELSPDQRDLLTLWEMLDPIRQAEFKGELRGYVKAMGDQDVPV